MVACVAYFSGKNAQEDPAFIFYTQDTIPVPVYEIRDRDDRLTAYQARVYTPICEEEECYEVELDFFWDLTGNFTHYEIIPEKPLTKKEHDPFSDEDYRKLTEVLLDDDPAFANMEKEDLIQKVSDDSVDGYTGATILTIRDEIVPGAAYSCFTLWHIAHGDVIDSVKINTASHFDRQMVEGIVTSEDESDWYFLADYFDEEDFQMYASEIMTLIEREGGYIARYLINKMPVACFAEEDVQLFFQKQFSRLGYFGQQALVDKLKDIDVVPSLLAEMIRHLQARDSALNQGIMGVCCRQLSVLPPEEIKHFMTLVLENKVSMDDECLDSVLTVVESKVSNKAARKFGRKFNKMSNQ